MTVLDALIAERTALRAAIATTEKAEADTEAKQRLIQTQLNFMRGYEAVLGARIEDLTGCYSWYSTEDPPCSESTSTP